MSLEDIREKRPREEEDRDWHDKRPGQGAPTSWEEAWSTLSAEGAHPADTLIWPSALQNWEKELLPAPILWHFGTATRETHTCGLLR